MRYELREHTADVAVEAWGETVGAAFAAVADGMAAAMCEEVPASGDRFDVEVAGEPPLHVQGNAVDHEYTITRNGTTVATVSKRWFRIRDTYGVEVMPGEDHAFVLAVAAAIDQI